MSTRNLDYIINLRNGTFSSGMSSAIGKAQQLDNTFKRLIGTATAFFSISEGARLVKDTSEIFMKMQALDTQLKSFSGNEYSRNMDEINRSVRDLKLPIEGATEGMTKWYTAATLAGLGADDARTAYRGLSMASRVFQLDSQRYGLVMNALTQMLSKGKVSAEELRQQLGEHLPGAVDMAARSLGMTQIQLNKALEKGAINSKTFVAKFGAQMVQEYQERIPAALKTTQARIDGLNNKIYEHQMQVGEKVIPLYVKWLEIKIQLLDKIQQLTKYYDAHKETIDKVLSVTFKLAAGYLIVKGLIWANAVATGAYNAYLVISRLVTAQATVGLWTYFGALSAVRAVMLTMGFGLVIAGIGLLVSRVMKAREPWDKMSSSIRNSNTELSAVSDGMTSATEGVNTFLDTIGGSEADTSFRKWRENIAGIKTAQESLGKWKDFSVTPDGYVQWKKDEQDKFWEKWQAGGTIPSFYGGKSNPMNMDNDPNYKGGYAFAFDLFDNGNKKGGSSKTTTGATMDESVSSGRSVRNVSVVIEKGIEKVEIHSTQLQESMPQIKKMLTDLLNRAVLDFEAAL